MSIPITRPAQWRYRAKNPWEIKTEAEYQESLRPPPQPDVTFYLDPHVAEFSPEETVRWAILGSGRMAAGPGSKLLHADMMNGARTLGEGEAMVVGFVYWYRRAWLVALVQPIGAFIRDEQVRELCARLKSWDDFLAGERVIWPEPGDGQMVRSIIEKIDRETVGMTRGDER